MRRKKRILSVAILLILTIFFDIVAPTNFKVNAATAHSVDEALTWATSQVGKSLDYDGAYGAQCVDLIAYYYAYLGAKTPGGNAIDYATNKLPSGWTRVYSGYRPGDIAVYHANYNDGTYSTGGYGHIAIIEQVNSSYLYVIDQNGYRNKGYCQNGNKAPLGIIKCAIRPDFGSATNTVDSWVKNTGVTSITETTARINAAVSPGAKVSELGFYLGTSPSSMTKIVENSSAYAESIWYDLGTGKWTGALASGTTYYYQIYAVISGTTYMSAVDSFTTTGVAVTSEFPLVENGIYKIRSVSSGKLIDVPGGSGENGTLLHQWQDNGTINQQWNAMRQSDGYTFVSAYNGKVMDIAMGSFSAGAKLTQCDYNGSGAQRFKLVHRGNGRYSMHSVCSNLALDIYGGSTDNGGEIHQYAYHGGNNQLFTFELVDSQPPVISNCRVTDVTYDGYTVVCDVTDNVGVSRVCFPTWTENNGQDDIDGDWYNNATATAVSGNTYSFRVNKSAHNNESGLYTTHIYAYDLSGNQVSGGVQCTVPVKEAEDANLTAFVERMYTVALGRTAEASGVNYWKNQLKSYQADGAGIARGFILGSEFTNKRYSNSKYIEILYKTFFDRTADASGQAYWIQLLNSGQSRECVLSGFVNSSEFSTICSNYGISRGYMQSNGVAINPGICRFAERLYTKVLGRAGEQEGMEYWAIQISGGACTPEAAAQGFFHSGEYRAKNTSNDSYIRALYATFMDRTPDASGLSYWNNILNSGTSREAVLSGFANSAEFKQIMQSYGL